MAEDLNQTHEEAPEGGGAGLPFLFLMLAAVIVVVAAVVGLVQTSETLMLAVALPALGVCLVVVLTYVVRLAGEGGESESEVHELALRHSPTQGESHPMSTPHAA